VTGNNLEKPPERGTACSKRGRNLVQDDTPAPSPRFTRVAQEAKWEWEEGGGENIVAALTSAVA
jgi:hypothetical protein